MISPPFLCLLASSGAAAAFFIAVGSASPTRDASNKNLKSGSRAQSGTPRGACEVPVAYNIMSRGRWAPLFLAGGSDHTSATCVPFVPAPQLAFAGIAAFVFVCAAGVSAWVLLWRLVFPIVSTASGSVS